MLQGVEAAKGDAVFLVGPAKAVSGKIPAHEKARAGSFVKLQAAYESDEKISTDLKGRLEALKRQMEAVKRERAVANDDARHVRAQMVATSQMKGGDKLFNTEFGATYVTDDPTASGNLGKDWNYGQNFAEKNAKALNHGWKSGKDTVHDGGVGMFGTMGVGLEAPPPPGGCPAGEKWVAWAKECESTLASKMNAWNEEGEYSYDTYSYEGGAGHLGKDHAHNYFSTCTGNYKLTLGGGEYEDEISIEIPGVGTFDAGTHIIRLQGQTKYQLIPHDSYGDGWNGATADLQPMC